MSRVCLALALFCLAWAEPSRAFNWQTATARGRDYVTLQSFCQFYNFSYFSPGGNTIFDSRSPIHSLRLKMGSPDMYLDGVHYVMSFPVELGDRDWLVSRMDVIKLFDPILRPQEIAGRHTIRGVVIDAGHGGTDNGATSRLGAEKNYTIDTALRLEAILNNAGIRTVLTRRNDVFVDLYERAHIASMYPDYAFVSIHYNSASPEARGLETYCLAPRGAASTSSSYLTRADIQELPGNDDDAQNILLASAVHSEIIRLNPGDPSMDRGVKRARFVVIKANQLPAILVEGGFVSNRMEAARVNSPGYRQALAQCIARGLIKFANIMGGRHMAMPGDVDIDTGLRPQAVAPAPVPNYPGGVGLPPRAVAVDPAGKVIGPKVAKTGTSSSSHKKKKGKLAKTGKPVTPVAQTSPVPVPIAPATAPTPAETFPDETTLGSKGRPLGLTEGAIPTPTADAEKAPPEPDEPPTGSGPSTNGAAAHEP
jgi:N-acetylmuramoyl-L-alanine amidase